MCSFVLICTRRGYRGGPYLSDIACVGCHVFDATLQQGVITTGTSTFPETTVQPKLVDQLLSAVMVIYNGVFGEHIPKERRLVLSHELYDGP